MLYRERMPFTSLAKKVCEVRSGLLAADRCRGRLFARAWLSAAELEVRHQWQRGDDSRGKRIEGQKSCFFGKQKGQCVRSSAQAG